MDTLQPIGVTVIGTGDGGSVPDGTIAQTPSNAQPNLVVTVITPVLALLVRFVNIYVTTIVSLVSAGRVSDVLPMGDFGELVLACAKLALSVAGLDLLKNIVTIFGKLEGKYPLLTGSV